MNKSVLTSAIAAIGLIAVASAPAMAVGDYLRKRQRHN